MRMIVLLLLVGFMTLIALIIKVCGFISCSWLMLFIPLLATYTYVTFSIAIYCVIEYIKNRNDWI